MNLDLLLDFLALMSNSQAPRVAQGLEDHMSQPRTVVGYSPYANIISDVP